MTTSQNTNIITCTNLISYDIIKIYLLIINKFKTRSVSCTVSCTYIIHIIRIKI